MDNYTSLLERISASAGLPQEEIERKIEAKRAKLSGLISKEGAAQIVSAELGINFDNQRMKISEIVHGMKRVNLFGKVTKVFPVREFNKNGREGKIGSFLLGDASSNTRIVLWDTNHIDLIEKGELKEGSVIEVSNASVRNGEVHLSAFSDIKKSNEEIKDVKVEQEFEMLKLKDAREGLNAQLRAFVVQVFEPRYFDDKREPGKKRALLNVVLDDGTENMRAVLFAEKIYDLGFTEEEVFDVEKFNEKKKGLLGEEKFFVGMFKKNAYFGNIEFTINQTKNLNVEELVKELEAKS